MRVIDCEGLQETIQLDRETIMVMCYTPKIIVFETELELSKFKRAWEEIIAKHYEENEEEIDPDYELQDMATMYVDHFEEESWMVRNSEYTGRKAKVVPLSDSQAKEYSWQNTIATHFGILNSGDIWTDMYTLEKHCEMIKLMFDTESMSKRLKEDTRKMFEQILEVWEEDLSEFYVDCTNYFKVDVKVD